MRAPTRVRCTVQSENSSSHGADIAGVSRDEAGTAGSMCTSARWGVGNVWREDAGTGVVRLNEQSALSLCDFMKLTLVYSQHQKRRQEKGRVAFKGQSRKGLLWGSRCLRDCVLILVEPLDL